VLQEVFLEVSRRADEYVADPKIPFFLWLHLLARQRLLIIHRRYFDAKMRDANLEISLNTGPMPQATSGSLAAHLLGKLTTPSQALIRAELQLQLQQALNSMDPLDREVLTLRHFEEMSNGETAVVLNVSKAAASNRYVRALKRLKEILTGIHGLEQL
jgi:RNA polymerase sigma-70 factor (ECF subfamily)